MGLALVFLVAAGMAPVLASYRVVAGDQLQISVFGEEEPWVARVDVDGSIRLPAVGTLEVDGLDLDGIEERVAARLSETGLFVSPILAVSVAEHAPIYVTGDVREPGAHPFSPRLTVGTAAGLAGGPGLAGSGDTPSVVARADFVGQERALAREALMETWKGRRLAAHLSDADMDMPDETAAPAVQALARTEADAMRSDREAMKELERNWTEEFDELEQQGVSLSRRIANQEKIITLNEENLARAQKLKNRGLQTLTELSRAQQALTDAQSRMFDLDVLLSQNRSRRASVRREQTRFRADRRRRLLTEAAETQTRLDEIAAERERVRAKIAASDTLALSSSEAIAVRYLIRRREGEAVRTIEAEATTPVRPGDEVAVRIEMPDVPAVAIDPVN